MSADKEESDHDQFGKMEDESGKSPDEIENDIKSTPMVTWDPFTVLPKEIYVKIFNKLENPDDKQNFMNAHKKWYDLFKTERTSFLFRKVCTTLALKEKIRSEDKFLDLRLVCRDWNLAVQNYIQLHPSLFEFWHDVEVWFNGSRIRSWRNEEFAKLCATYRIAAATDKFVWVKMTRAEEVEMQAQHLQEVLKSHPASRNPNLTRMFSLNGNPMVRAELNLDMDVTRRWWNQIRIYLETFGQHIWHGILFFNLRREPDVYSEIFKWLKLMPNLKTLHLYEFGLRMGECNDIDAGQVTLEKLQVLQANDTPPFLYNKIVEGAKNLEKLRILDSWSNKSSLIDYQMENLVATLKEACLSMKKVEDFEYLRSLEQFPLLRRLIITLEFPGSRDKEYNTYLTWPEWEIIWSMLEEKFPALEDLDLRLPNMQIPDKKKGAIEQSLKCRLHLPNLKKLRIVLPNLSSLDFLLPAKNLENLHVFIEHTDRTDWYCRSYASEELGKEILKFNQDLGTMWDSNIWDKFPKLKKLVIEAVHPWGSYRNRMMIDVHDYEKIGETKKYSDSQRE